MALIELFDVRPDDDEAFLADRRREGNGTLYRALRDDAAPRFVRIAAGGAYGLVHEDRTADPAGGAVRIEAFDDAQLLPSWRQARDAFSRRRGYRSTRLYHNPTATDFRFVAFAHWSSPLMVARALREPEVQAAVVLVASQPGAVHRARRVTSPSADRRAHDVATAQQVRRPGCRAAVATGSAGAGGGAGGAWSQRGVANGATVPPVTGRHRSPIEPSAGMRRLQPTKSDQ